MTVYDIEGGPGEGVRGGGAEEGMAPGLGDESQSSVRGLLDELMLLNRPLPWLLVAELFITMSAVEPHGLWSLGSVFTAVSISSSLPPPPRYIISCFRSIDKHCITDEANHDDDGQAS